MTLRSGASLQTAPFRAFGGATVLAICNANASAPRSASRADPPLFKIGTPAAAESCRFSPASSTCVSRAKGTQVANREKIAPKDAHQSGPAHSVLGYASRDRASLFGSAPDGSLNRAAKSIRL